MKDEDDTIVVSCSDSEEDECKVWIKKSKNKQFIQLWRSVQPILFHHVLPEYKSTYFPYEKFQTLAEDLRKALTLVYVNSTQAFIWKNLIRWLTSMKLCYEGFSDLKYDERYNLILTDFMAQYMNYKCNLYSTITDETEVCRRVDEILFTLGVVFSGNVPGILMTLLKIEVKDAYRLILDPIFRKYLSNKSLHEPDDLICYLRLILCYRQWKKLSHFKEDKELINEIAVGISEKSLNTRYQLSGLPIKEPVLPKIVPPVNENNRPFTVIAGLIGFAIRNKTFGTRILLINKSLDLEETIGKFFQQYEKHIMRSDSTLCETTRALRLFNDHWDKKKIPQAISEPLFGSKSKSEADVPTSSPAKQQRTETLTQPDLQNEKNINKQGTSAASQRLFNCDISSLSNTLSRSNLSSYLSEKPSHSNKPKTQNRYSSLELSNSHGKDFIIDLDTIDEENNDVDSHATANIDHTDDEPSVHNAVPCKNQTDESARSDRAFVSFLKKLQNQTIAAGNRTCSSEKVDTIVLSSSSDEDEAPAINRSTSAVVRPVVNPSRIGPYMAPVVNPSRTGPEIAPPLARVTGRTNVHAERSLSRREKSYATTGEVSSTTLLDCSSREVEIPNVSHLSARCENAHFSPDYSDFSDDEAGPSSWTGHRRTPRFSWSKFEERISSTSEILTRSGAETPSDNVVFSMHPFPQRRSTSNSPCPTRTTSPTDIFPSSTIKAASMRFGTSPRPLVTSVNRTTVKNPNSFVRTRDRSEETPLCSRYVGRLSPRMSYDDDSEERGEETRQSSEIVTDLALNSISEEPTCSRYVATTTRRLSSSEQVPPTASVKSKLSKEGKPDKSNSKPIESSSKACTSITPKRTKGANDNDQHSLTDNYADLDRFLNDITLHIGEQSSSDKSADRSVLTDSQVISATSPALISNKEPVEIKMPKKSEVHELPKNSEAEPSTQRKITLPLQKHVKNKIVEKTTQNLKSLPENKLLNSGSPVFIAKNYQNQESSTEILKPLVKAHQEAIVLEENEKACKTLKEDDTEQSHTESPPETAKTVLEGQEIHLSEPDSLEKFKTLSQINATQTDISLERNKNENTKPLKVTEESNKSLPAAIIAKMPSPFIEEEESVDEEIESPAWEPISPEESFEKKKSSEKAISGTETQIVVNVTATENTGTELLQAQIKSASSKSFKIKFDDKKTTKMSTDPIIDTEILEDQIATKIHSTEIVNAEKVDQPVNLKPDIEMTVPDEISDEKRDSVVETSSIAVNDIDRISRSHETNEKSAHDQPVQVASISEPKLVEMAKSPKAHVDHVDVGIQCGPQDVSVNSTDDDRLVIANEEIITHAAQIAEQTDIEKNTSQNQLEGGVAALPKDLKQQVRTINHAFEKSLNLESTNLLTPSKEVIEDQEKIPLADCERIAQNQKVSDSIEAVSKIILVKEKSAKEQTSVSCYNEPKLKSVECKADVLSESIPLNSKQKFNKEEKRVDVEFCTQVLQKSVESFQVPNDTEETVKQQPNNGEKSEDVECHAKVPLESIQVPYNTEQTTQLEPDMKNATEDVEFNTEVSPKLFESAFNSIEAANKEQFSKQNTKEEENLSAENRKTLVEKHAEGKASTEKKSINAKVATCEISKADATKSNVDNAEKLVAINSLAILQRPEYIPNEDNSNLSTQAQVKSEKLGDLPVSLDSATRDILPTAYGKKTQQSFDASTSATEDQEVSKITSQKGEPTSCSSYHEDCGTPVLDEKDENEIESPSTTRKIISLSILKEIPSDPVVPIFSDTAPSLKHVGHEDANKILSPVVNDLTIARLVSPTVMVDVPTTPSPIETRFIEPSPKPKPNSDADSEYQKTPLKMRLKRLSQSSDMSEAFNLQDKVYPIEITKVQSLEAQNGMLFLDTFQCAQSVSSQNLPLNLVIRPDDSSEGEILPEAPKKRVSFEIMEEDENLCYQETWRKKRGISKTPQKTNRLPNFSEASSKEVLCTKQEEAALEVVNTPPEIVKGEGRRRKPGQVKKVTENDMNLSKVTFVSEENESQQKVSAFQAEVGHQLAVKAISELQTLPIMETSYNPEDIKAATILSEMFKNSNKIEDRSNIDEQKRIETPRKSQKRKTLKQVPVRLTRLTRSTSQFVDRPPAKVTTPKKSKVKKTVKTKISTETKISPSSSCETIWQQDKTKEILRSLTLDSPLKTIDTDMPNKTPSVVSFDKIISCSSDSDDAGKLVIDFERKASPKSRRKSKINSKRKARGGKTFLENVRELLDSDNPKLKLDIAPPTVIDYSEGVLQSPNNVFKLTSEVDVYFPGAQKPDMTKVDNSADVTISPTLMGSESRSSDDECARLYPIIQLTEDVAFVSTPRGRGRRSRGARGRGARRKILKDKYPPIPPILPIPPTENKSAIKTSQQFTKPKAGPSAESIQKPTPAKQLVKTPAECGAAEATKADTNLVARGGKKSKPKQKERLSFGIDTILGKSIDSAHKGIPTTKEERSLASEIVMNKEVWVPSFPLKKSAKSLSDIVKELSENQNKGNDEPCSSGLSMSTESLPDCVQARKVRNRRKSQVTLKLRSPTRLQVNEPLQMDGDLQTTMKNRRKVLRNTRKICNAEQTENSDSEPVPCGDSPDNQVKSSRSTLTKKALENSRSNAKKTQPKSKETWETHESIVPAEVKLEVSELETVMCTEVHVSSEPLKTKSKQRKCEIVTTSLFNTVPDQKLTETSDLITASTGLKLKQLREEMDITQERSQEPSKPEGQLKKKNKSKGKKIGECFTEKVALENVEDSTTVEAPENAAEEISKCPDVANKVTLKKSRKKSKNNLDASSRPAVEETFEHTNIPTSENIAEECPSKLVAEPKNEPKKEVSIRKPDPEILQTSKAPKISETKSKKSKSKMRKAAEVKEPQKCPDKTELEADSSKAKDTLVDIEDNRKCKKESAQPQDESEKQNNGNPVVEDVPNFEKVTQKSTDSTNTDQTRSQSKERASIGSTNSLSANDMQKTSKTKKKSKRNLENIAMECPVEKDTLIDDMRGGSQIAKNISNRRENQDKSNESLKNKVKIRPIDETAAVPDNEQYELKFVDVSEKTEENTRGRSKCKITAQSVDDELSEKLLTSADFTEIPEAAQSKSKPVEEEADKSLKTKFESDKTTFKTTKGIDLLCNKDAKANRAPEKKKLPTEKKLRTKPTLKIAEHLTEEKPIERNDVLKSESKVVAEQKMQSAKNSETIDASQYSDVVKETSNNKSQEKVLSGDKSKSCEENLPVHLLNKPRTSGSSADYTCEIKEAHQESIKQSTAERSELKEVSSNCTDASSSAKRIKTRKTNQNNVKRDSNLTSTDLKNTSKSCDSVDDVTKAKEEHTQPLLRLNENSSEIIATHETEAEKELQACKYDSSCKDQKVTPEPATNTAKLGVVGFGKKRTKAIENKRPAAEEASKLEPTDMLETLDTKGQSIEDVPKESSTESMVFPSGDSKKDINTLQNAKSSKLLKTAENKRKHLLISESKSVPLAKETIETKHDSNSEHPANISEGKQTKPLENKSTEQGWQNKTTGEVIKDTQQQKVTSAETSMNLEIASAPETNSCHVKLAVEPVAEALNEPSNSNSKQQQVQDHDQPEPKITNCVELPKGTERTKSEKTRLVVESRGYIKQINKQKTIKTHSDKLPEQTDCQSLSTRSVASKSGEEKELPEVASDKKLELKSIGKKRRVTFATDLVSVIIPRPKQTRNEQSLIDLALKSKLIVRIRRTSMHGLNRKIVLDKILPQIGAGAKSKLVKDSNILSSSSRTYLAGNSSKPMTAMEDSAVEEACLQKEVEKPADITKEKSEDSVCAGKDLVENSDCKDTEGKGLQGHREGSPQKPENVFEEENSKSVKAETPPKPDSVAVQEKPIDIVKTVGDQDQKEINLNRDLKATEEDTDAIVFQKEHPIETVATVNSLAQRKGNFNQNLKAIERETTTDRSITTAKTVKSLDQRDFNQEKEVTEKTTDGADVQNEQSAATAETLDQAGESANNESIFTETIAIQKEPPIETAYNFESPDHVYLKGGQDLKKAKAKTETIVDQIDQSIETSKTVELRDLAPIDSLQDSHDMKKRTDGVDIQEQQSTETSRIAKASKLSKHTDQKTEDKDEPPTPLCSELRGIENKEAQAIETFTDFSNPCRKALKTYVKDKTCRQKQNKKETDPKVIESVEHRSVQDFKDNKTSKIPSIATNQTFKTKSEDNKNKHCRNLLKDLSIEIHIKSDFLKPSAKRYRASLDCNSLASTPKSLPKRCHSTDEIRISEDSQGKKIQTVKANLKDQSQETDLSKKVLKSACSEQIDKVKEEQDGEQKASNLVVEIPKIIEPSSISPLIQDTHKSLEEEPTKNTEAKKSSTGKEIQPAKTNLEDQTQGPDLSKEDLISACSEQSDKVYNEEHDGEQKAAYLEVEMSKIIEPSPVPQLIEDTNEPLVEGSRKNTTAKKNSTTHKDSNKMLPKANKECKSESTKAVKETRPIKQEEEGRIILNSAKTKGDLKSTDKKRKISETKDELIQSGTLAHSEVHTGQNALAVDNISTVKRMKLADPNCSDVEIASIPIEPTQSSSEQEQQLTLVNSEVESQSNTRRSTDINYELELSITNIFGNIQTNGPQGFDSVPDEILAGNGDPIDSIETTKFFRNLLNPDNLMLERSLMENTNRVDESENVEQKLDAADGLKQTAQNQSEQEAEELENAGNLAQANNSAPELELDPFDINAIANSSIFNFPSPEYVENDNWNAKVSGEIIEELVPNYECLTEEEFENYSPFGAVDCRLNNRGKTPKRNVLPENFNPPKEDVTPDIDLVFVNELFAYSDLVNIQSREARGNSQVIVEAVLTPMDIDRVDAGVGSDLPSTLTQNDESRFKKPASVDVAVSDVAQQSTINYYIPPVEVSTEVGFETYDELIADNNTFFPPSDLEKRRKSTLSECDSDQGKIDAQEIPIPVVVENSQTVEGFSEAVIDEVTPDADQRLSVALESSHGASEVATSTVVEVSECAPVKKHKKNHISRADKLKLLAAKLSPNKATLKKEEINTPPKLKSHATAFWRRNSIQNSVDTVQDSKSKDSIDIEPRQGAEAAKEARTGIAANEIEVQPQVLLTPQAELNKKASLPRSGEPPSKKPRIEAINQVSTDDLFDRLKRETSVNPSVRTAKNVLADNTTDKTGHNSIGYSISSAEKLPGLEPFPIIEPSMPLMSSPSRFDQTSDISDQSQAITEANNVDISTTTPMKVHPIAPVVSSVKCLPPKELVSQSQTAINDKTLVVAPLSESKSDSTMCKGASLQKPCNVSPEVLTSNTATKSLCHNFPSHPISAKPQGVVDVPYSDAMARTTQLINEPAPFSVSDSVEKLSNRVMSTKSLHIEKPLSQPSSKSHGDSANLKLPSQPNNTLLAQSPKAQEISTKTAKLEANVELQNPNEPAFVPLPETLPKSSKQDQIDKPLPRSSSLTGVVHNVSNSETVTKPTPVKEPTTTTPKVIEMPQPLLGGPTSTTSENNTESPTSFSKHVKSVLRSKLQNSSLGSEVSKPSVSPKPVHSVPASPVGSSVKSPSVPKRPQSETFSKPEGSSTLASPRPVNPTQLSPAAPMTRSPSCSKKPQALSSKHTSTRAEASSTMVSPKPVYPTALSPAVPITKSTSSSKRPQSFSATHTPSRSEASSTVVSPKPVYPTALSAAIPITNSSSFSKRPQSFSAPSKSESSSPLISPKPANSVPSSPVMPTSRSPFLKRPQPLSTSSTPSKSEAGSPLASPSTRSPSFAKRPQPLSAPYTPSRSEPTSHLVSPKPVYSLPPSPATSSAKSSSIPNGQPGSISVRSQEKHHHGKDARANRAHSSKPYPEHNPHNHHSTPHRRDVQNTQQDRNREQSNLNRDNASSRAAGHIIVLASLSAEVDTLTADLNKLPAQAPTFPQYKERKRVLELLEAKRNELDELRKRYQDEERKESRAYASKSHSMREPLHNDAGHRVDVHSSQRESKEKQPRRVYVNKFGELGNKHSRVPTFGDEPRASSSQPRKTLPAWEPKPINPEDIIAGYRKRSHFDTS